MGTVDTTPVSAKARIFGRQAAIDSPPRVSAQLGIFCGLFALAVLLQILSGVFLSEFNAYPDEPAHYVTSLMVREYIVSPHPFSPLKFAENYYQHYPKVAFGHWPPVFYAVQALWMLVFSASRASVRLEIAFTTAVLAFSLWREARRWFGNRAAVLAASLLICIPLVQNATDEEMSETLLVLFCFWSTIYFGRYLDSGKRSDSLWFGLYFSLAVLTKGSGWLLTLLPPIALLLTRRTRLLLRPAFWYGIFLIALLCLPWQVLTLRSAERGWTGGSHPSIGYTLSALAQFFWVSVSILGPVLSLVIAVGIVTRVIAPAFSKPVKTVPAIMLGLILGDWIFHSLVPAGVEDRKMILAVPALIYFLFAGGIWIADRLPLGERLVAWRRRIVALAAALVFIATTFTIPGASPYGYIQAAKFVVSDPRLHTPATLLVSSGSIGEGLLISEIAMREPRPRDTVLRATKELARMNWTATSYRSLFTEPSQLLDYLDRAHVDAVVLDNYQGLRSFPHQRLVERTIQANPGDFERLAVFPGRAGAITGQVEIYRYLRHRSSRGTL